MCALSSLLYSWSLILTLLICKINSETISSTSQIPLSTLDNATASTTPISPSAATPTNITNAPTINATGPTPPGPSSPTTAANTFHLNITSQSDNQTIRWLAKAGGRVNWTVLVNESSPYKFTWFDTKGNNITSTSSKFVKNETTSGHLQSTNLFILHLNVEDSGKYTLRAENGTHIKNVSFYLRVKDIKCYLDMELPNDDKRCIIVTRDQTKLFGYYAVSRAYDQQVSYKVIYDNDGAEFKEDIVTNKGRIQFLAPSKFHEICFKSKNKGRRKRGIRQELRDKGVPKRDYSRTKAPIVHRATTTRAPTPRTTTPRTTTPRATTPRATTPRATTPRAGTQGPNNGNIGWSTPDVKPQTPQTGNQGADNSHIGWAIPGVNSQVPHTGALNNGSVGWSIPGVSSQIPNTGNQGPTNGSILKIPSVPIFIPPKHGAEKDKLKPPKEKDSLNKNKLKLPKVKISKIKPWRIGDPARVSLILKFGEDKDFDDFTDLQTLCST